MRNRFERQLLELNNELIQMGSMIERAIEMGISALVRQDVEKAKKASADDEEIDEQEKTVESRCMKLLLQQQPVAKDLRLISAAVSYTHLPEASFAMIPFLWMSRRMSGWMRCPPRAMRGDTSEAACRLWRASV